MERVEYLASAQCLVTVRIVECLTGKHRKKKKTVDAIRFRRVFFFAFA